jgi:hypothetical protein
MGRPSFLELATATTLYLAVTVLFAYPLSVHPGTTVFGDNPDTHLYIWTLSWDTHKFLHQPLTIFDANFYYPNPLTLAYSENSIGSALFAAPVLWLTGNPVLAMNLTQLLAGVLCGLGVYVLARVVGVSAGGALISGVVFAFAPPRFVRTGQLYLGTMQWMPLALASLHAYFSGGRKWALRMAVALFTLQAFTSGHGAVFLVLAAACLLTYRFVLGEPLSLRRRLRDFGFASALWLAPAMLLYWPYHRVQVEMGLRRTLDDWAPTWVSFIAAPTHVQQWLLSWLPGLHVRENASAYLFPGVVPLLLAGIAIASRWRERRSASPNALPARSRGRTAAALLLDGIALVALLTAIAVLASGPIRWRLGTVLVTVRDAWRPLFLCAAAAGLRISVRRPSLQHVRQRLGDAVHAWRRSASEWRRDPVIFYVLLTLVFVWLSIGPPIGLWPAVYWMPGLSFIRVPSRFMIPAMLAISVLAGIGFDRLAARFSVRSRTWIVMALFALMIVEFAGMPLPVVPFSVDIPAADRWLATQPTPFVVAEFPVTLSIRQQTTYMLHSMAHWQKTIHGYSGFEAPLHTTLYQVLRAFPDEISLRRLRELDVTYLVVHDGFYPAGERERLDKRLQRFADQLALQHADSSGRVYTLRRHGE